MAKPIYITQDGKVKLEEELDYLKNVKRDEVGQKIKIARSYGDLSENSEYDDARDEQAQIESRIAELEATLRNAVVITEDDISTEHINVGSRVRLENATAKKEVEYKIVGSKETNPREGKISDESPIGSALLGHSVGDYIEVETPGGSLLTFKVLEISI